jgi:membrane protease YdiL (CAAX protease family)
MASNRTFAQRWGTTLYFMLTFAISWGGILWAAGVGGLGDTAALEANLPVVYAATLAGPTVAGLLMIALVGGRDGLRGLLDRLLQWRVGAHWYAVALLSSDFRAPLLDAEAKAATIFGALAAGLVVGLFEEIGWTGFATPRLRRQYGMALTGIMLGLVWGAWHFPLFWENDTFAAAIPLALLLVRLFSWLPPYRLLMVWVHDHTDSLLVVVLMHMSLVATQFLLAPVALSGASLLTWLLAWAAVLWIMAAAVTRTAHRGDQRPIQPPSTSKMAPLT